MINLSPFELLKKRELWPSKNDESWKYFDLKMYESLTASSVLNTVRPSQVFCDDIYSEIVISPTEIRIAKNLEKLIQIKVLKYLDLVNTVSNLDFSLTTLNRENFGLAIEVTGQKNLSLKISYTDDGQALCTFLKISVNDSNLNLIEEDLTKGSLLFSLHMQMEISNSTVEHIAIFQGLTPGKTKPSDQAKIYNSEIKVGEKSLYKNICILLKNKLIRVQQSIMLDHEECIGHLNAFNISEDKNFSELRTEVLHLKPRTESRQLFKTISADQAQSVFNGRIFVDSQAQKTDASQLCQGILLSEKALINAKPELEIYADDVKAAHGAAIGQLGLDQIFYLVSRGISPETAYKMLSKAFAGEVLSAIDSLELRKKCHSIIEKSSKTVFEKLAQTINRSGGL